MLNVIMLSVVMLIVVAPHFVQQSKVSAQSIFCFANISAEILMNTLG
jgi:hypothetical protein